MNDLTPFQMPVQAEPVKQFAIVTLDDMREVASNIAGSGMFGIKKTEQAMTLMIMCKEEGQTLTQGLRRYHVFDDGKLSQRAAYSQGEFEQKSGHIIWHVRTDEMCAATFYLKGSTEDKAAILDRGIKRFKLLWEMESARDAKAKSSLVVQLAELSREGEATILRTFADAKAKGITEGRTGTKTNWLTSPRQMLTARVVSEGVTLIDPALLAGLYSEDEVADIINQEAKAREERLNPTPEQQQQQLQEMNDAITLKEKARLKSQGVDPSMAEPMEIAKELPVDIKPAVSTQPEAQSDAGGHPEKPETPSVEEEDWTGYRLKYLTSKAYKDKLLTELTADELKTLWKKRCEPQLADITTSAELRAEAFMVERAVKSAGV